jgi:hypothetical protein
MMLFDHKGVIKRYETPEQILEEFFHLRIDYYEKRRLSLLQVSELNVHYCQLAHQCARSNKLQLSFRSSASACLLRMLKT